MDSLKKQRYWLLISFFVGYILIPSADFVTDIITASKYIGSSYWDWDPNISVPFYIPQDAEALDELDSFLSTFLINHTELNFIQEMETIELPSHSNTSSAKFRYIVSAA